MAAYVLAGGVQWCTTHYGIVDELESFDPNGTCDMYDDGDGDETCHIVDLYFIDEPAADADDEAE